MIEIIEMHEKVKQMIQGDHTAPDYKINLYHISKEFIKMADRLFMNGEITQAQHEEITAFKYEFIARYEAENPHLVSEYL